MKVKDIHNVLILGSGRMGQQIGLVTALHGYNVITYDISQELIDNALKNMQKLAGFFLKRGAITEKEANEAMNRIRGTVDPEKAGKNADIVSESIPEDPELKGKVFGQFNKICPTHTIFTTNTSTLLPSQLAEATGRPEKFCCLHFHDVRMSNIVDVMPHAGTDKEVAELVKEFAIAIGQLPIMLHRESRGFVYNAMFEALLNAAQKLASQGIASIEDIDRAWMGIQNVPIGPFGMMDQVGLKTVYSANKYWADQTGDKSRIMNAEFIKKYVDAGKLGVMTGEGFYKYPDPPFKDPDFIKKIKLQKGV